MPQEAKFRVVITWVAEQVFELYAANMNEAELRAVKLSPYEQIRLRPNIRTSQQTPYTKTDSRVAAVVQAAR